MNIEDLYKQLLSEKKIPISIDELKVLLEASYDEEILEKLLLITPEWMRTFIETRLSELVFLSLD